MNFIFYFGNRYITKNHEIYKIYNDTIKKLYTIIFRFDHNTLDNLLQFF